MSALLNEDERALRDAVRSFLDKKVAPRVAAHEQAREATIPEGTSQIQILQLGKALLGHSALR